MGMIIQFFSDNIVKADWLSAVATFVTGMLVVFAALIALVIVVWAFGKIIASVVDAKSNKKKKSKEGTPAPTPSPKLVEVVSDDGLSDEVVAAITGAVSVILSEEGSSGSFAIKSIKRTRQTSSAWGTAGVIENTRPF